MKGTLPGLIRCDQGSSLQEEFEKHFTFYLRRSATEAHNDQAFVERGNNVMDLLRTVLAATALPTFMDLIVFRDFYLHQLCDSEWKKLNAF